ncbi:MAG: efflux transporter outer membrane subunit [Gammaproteobacteria bacterium]|nr:efflux transporter outer membrane subunit [Gammaproteobacteria bacterium]MBU1847749.1 efflux transporter outer membrane subunit [Gammaproteobacteria bacterium]
MSLLPHRLPSPGAIVLLSLALAACTVGPDYRRPDAPAGAAFNGSAALAQRAAPPGARDPALWWTGFNDPLLDRVVAQALAQNLDLAAVAARVDQARARFAASRARRLPAGQLGADAAVAHQSVQTPLGRVLDARPGFDRNGEQYGLNAFASWDLDLAGGLRRGEQAAAAALQASEAAQAAARLDIVALAADTYMTVRGLQARLALARDQTALQRERVRLTRLQVSGGVAAPLQLHQAEGALTEVEATVPALEAALDAALNALDVLMGEAPGSWRAQLDAAAPIPTAPAISDAGGPASLIRRRPDLMAAERQLEAANARIGVALAGYYPQLSLSGLLGFATTGGGGALLSSGAAQAQLAGGLRWRLFDFGRVDADLAAARGGEAIALADYRQAVLRASEDVENALTALVKREVQARTLAAGEQSFVQARAQTQAAYDGGALSLLDVLDADARLLHSRDALIQARTGAARAAVASFRALGGGWNDGNVAPPDATVARQGAR